MALNEFVQVTYVDASNIKRLLPSTLQLRLGAYVRYSVKDSDYDVPALATHVRAGAIDEPHAVRLIAAARVKGDSLEDMKAASVTAPHGLFCTLIDRSGGLVAPAQTTCANTRSSIQCSQSQNTTH